MIEIIHHICLPIIRTPNETNIPSSPIPCFLTSQRWFYGCLSVCSKIVQGWKNQMERKISAPSVCPKFHSIPHPNLILDIFVKNFPTHPDTSPQNTPMNTPSQLRGPPPPQKKIFPKFQSYHSSPKPILLNPKTPKPLS